MAITDTQQTAQFAASAAVSAAEAKQYALSIEKPLIDISESVSEAKDAAVSSELARDEAKDIASGLSESINFELAEKEAEFESQMQGQRTAFEVSQQDKESDFLSSQSRREADFVESQTDRESRFQTFLDSSGYVFLGDYENGPFQFSARNQYIHYNNRYYRLNAATDVGFTTTGIDAASFASDVTHFVLMDGDTLRSNLGSNEGAKLSGYRYSNVYSALSRIKTLYDYGVVTAYGHNLAADSQVRRDAEDDNDLLIPGNVSIAKENRGVGRDGTALSVRMGTGDESGLGFFPQVTGVSSTVQLANYGDGTPDGVAAYIDITGNAYADWEDVSESDVVYTETGCILTSSTAKIKRGNVIKTKHDTPFVGIVNSVDGSVITLKDGWVAVGATETSTPTAGFGCYINPQNKVWAINSNLTLSENGRSTIGVIQELGILNRKGYNSEIGGIDLVHLAQSTFDSGYGLRIRPANNSTTRSISGVLVQGSRYSFYSAGSKGFSPTYGLFVAGQHEAGAMFSGVGAANTAIQVQNLAGVARTTIDGDGYVKRMHRNVLVASGPTLTVPDLYPDVISVVGIAQVITLANSGVVPRTVTIEKFSNTGNLVVQPASGNILYKGSYVANVSITGAGKIELRLINVTSEGLYQWAANVYQGV
ncbi:hypothetical protein [Klebsiella quasipneumoniae]|uniref:hypothetical protein n=1 Tax=Klebsiella quasipneumoniae TaxID=1463165 RepID=UPI000CC4D29C|nr:hypothetical protein [Klebsiella quasipneumoniae]PLJ43413.1 hypothetical protein B6J67_04250 [Klebsiella quasipneumoniae]PLJ65522.1 hypothetical protein B6J68_03740 [Klebsiella quasipneumoniae]